MPGERHSSRNQASSSESAARDWSARHSVRIQASSSDDWSSWRTELAEGAPLVNPFAEPELWPARPARPASIMRGRRGRRGRRGCAGRLEPRLRTHAHTITRPQTRWQPDVHTHAPTSAETTPLCSVVGLTNELGRPLRLAAPYDKEQENETECVETAQAPLLASFLGPRGCLFLGSKPT